MTEKEWGEYADALEGKAARLLDERDQLAAHVTQLRDALETYTVGDCGCEYEPCEAHKALSASPGVSRIENLVRAAREVAKPQDCGECPDYGPCKLCPRCDAIKGIRAALAEYERGGSG